jgi:hypothetical protein
MPAPTGTGGGLRGSRQDGWASACVLSAPPSGIAIHEVRATTEREEDRYYQAALLESRTPGSGNASRSEPQSVFVLRELSRRCRLSGDARGLAPGSERFSRISGPSRAPPRQQEFCGRRCWNGKEARRIELTPSGICGKAELHARDQASRTPGLSARCSSWIDSL